jgi:hypothetical protein
MYRSVWRLHILYIFLFVLFIEIPLVQAESPLIAEPDIIDFGIMKSPETKTKSIRIEKGKWGGGDLTWIVTGLPAWLSLDKNCGVISKSSENVFAVADSAELSPGQHRANIVIASAGGTRVIPVFATVLEGRHNTRRESLEKIILESDTTMELQVGRKMLLKAKGVYSDGSERDITGKVRWISKNPLIGDFLYEGLFSSRSAGKAEIYAKLRSIKSAAFEINVSPLEGALLSISTSKVEIFHVEEDSITKAATIKIKNGGRERLEWKAISKTPWLSVYSDTPEEEKIKGIKRDERKVTHLIKANSLNCARIDQAADAGGNVSGMHVSGSGTGEIYLVADSRDLREGAYDGEVIIRSNGGVEVVTVSIDVVSLKTISVSPVSVTMPMEKKMKFRAVGIWSDGKRTDISDHDNSRWVISDQSIGSFVSGRSVFHAKSEGSAEIKIIKGNVISNTVIINVEESEVEPVLMVSPREIDLGKVGPGERSKGVFTLKNVGTGTLAWSIENPGERLYLSKSDDLTGIIEDRPRYLRIFVESLIKTDTEVSQEEGLYPFKIRIDNGSDVLTYRKSIPEGTYRERLTLAFNDGVRNVFFRFTVSEVGSRPVIEVSPRGIDFGSFESGKKSAKKIKLKNTGKNVLVWRARLQENRKAFMGMPLTKGRYVSFQNDTTQNDDNYRVPDHMKQNMYVTGRWISYQGYPGSTAQNGEDALHYTFSGTGINVFIWKDVYGGMLNVFIDGISVKEIDCTSENRERFEFIAAEDLDEGEHTLTLAGRKGSVTIEGARIYSDKITAKGKKGWISIFPDRGTTTNETDYINVMTDTKDLLPGVYCENILFYSDEGGGIVEVSLELKGDILSELINIYKYLKGPNSAFAPKDSFSDQDLLKDYEEAGIAFRLFRKGMPGTREFFWWYNPLKRDYYYSSDRSGGDKSLRGYVFGGSIGNIATIRMQDTKELYRWYNPDRGTHFYTTDLKGEGRKKKGYRYDGIAGYVR